MAMHCTMRSIPVSEEELPISRKTKEDIENNSTCHHEQSLPLPCDMATHCTMRSIAKQDIGGIGVNTPSRIIVLVQHGVAVPTMEQVTSNNTVIATCHTKRKKLKRRKSGASQHKYGKGNCKKSKTHRFSVPPTVAPSVRPTHAKPAPTMQIMERKLNSSIQIRETLEEK
eukprot:7428093-Ditylum_brightwellii.AAC.2